MRGFFLLALVTTAWAKPLPAVPDHVITKRGGRETLTLGKSRALVKSGLAHIESWRQGPQERAKLERAVADLRAAVVAEPANLAAWIAIGNTYGEFADIPGRFAGATEVATAVGAAGCDACIEYLAGATAMDASCGDTRWDFTEDELEKLRALVKGKSSKLTSFADAGSFALAIASFDAARMHLGTSRVVAVVENGKKTALAGAKAVAAWFDFNRRFQLEAQGVLTCDAKCCRWLCRGPEGDVAHYLDKVCFAGDELARMEWHSGP
jgi:hypothetical protein